jgi:hypothetical protein
LDQERNGCADDPECGNKTWFGVVITAFLVLLNAATFMYLVTLLLRTFKGRKVLSFCCKRPRTRHSVHPESSLHAVDEAADQQEASTGAGCLGAPPTELTTVEHRTSEGASLNVFEDPPPLPTGEGVQLHGKEEEGSEQDVGVTCDTATLLKSSEIETDDEVSTLADNEPNKAEIDTETRKPRGRRRRTKEGEKKGRKKGRKKSKLPSVRESVATGEEASVEALVESSGREQQAGTEN